MIRMSPNRNAQEKETICKLTIKYSFYETDITVLFTIYIHCLLYRVTFCYAGASVS